MNLSRVVVIVAVTAAIVYFGLNVLLPNGKGKKTENAETAATTTEAVFGSTPAEAANTTPTEAAPATDAAPASTDTAASAEPAELTEEEARKIAESVGREVAERVANEAATPASNPAPAPTAEPIETAAAAPAPAPAPAPAYESAPASAPADTATTSTASDEPSGLTDEQARATVANIARENLAGGAVNTAPAVTPEPAVETAAAPAKTEAAKPAPAYETAAASSEPAAPRKPKPAKRASIAMPKAAAKAPGVGSDAVSSWWPKAGSQSADRLSLVYAGEAASEKAVVLMFGSSFSDATAAGSQIKLVDSRGASPSGTWELGRNPRLLVFKGVTPGRYTVILKPTLADGAGKTLGTELVGPVYVH